MQRYGHPEYNWRWSSRMCTYTSTQWGQAWNSLPMRNVTPQMSPSTGIETSEQVNSQATLNQTLSPQADCHSTVNNTFSPQYPGYGMLNNGQSFQYGNSAFTSWYGHRGSASDSIYKDSEVSSRGRSGVLRTERTIASSTLRLKDTNLSKCHFP